MKVAYLGCGSWGFCLASLLASKGYRVVSWTTDPALAKELNRSRRHPRFPEFVCGSNISFTTDLGKAVEGAELLAEAVTAEGIRPVFSELARIGVPSCPIVSTSKGIEKDNNLTMPELIAKILGFQHREQIGALSGPSFAQEVIRQLPTSIVATGYRYSVIEEICEAFSTDYLRIYPNQDVKGVAFGGALKNIVAIACGIAEGLKMGFSARAALLTRGLHEIRKLAVAKGCLPETFSGLSGLGDLCMTCSSPLSRNFLMGELIAQGFKPDEAKAKIGMVVEGAYSCIAALQMAKEESIPMPISECVYQILFEGLSPKEAVPRLMQRAIKEEHL